MENILLRHFEQFQDEINTLYESHFHKPFSVWSYTALSSDWWFIILPCGEWYRHVAVNQRTFPSRKGKSGKNTASLVGESRFRSGLMRTNGDILGHFPQAVENDTTFAPDAGGEDEETDFEMTFEAAEEPDYEDEEIAGHMADDETGQATGVEFEKLVEAVRTVNTPKPAEADKQQAAETLGQITGTTFTRRWWQTSTANWKR